jgi:hypothetical protein
MVQTERAHHLDKGALTNEAQPSPADDPPDSPSTILARQGTVVWPAAFRHPQTRVQVRPDRCANRKMTTETMFLVCPRCGGETTEIRGQIMCTHCHELVQGCCD